MADLYSVLKPDTSRMRVRLLPQRWMTEGQTFLTIVKGTY